MNAVVSYSEVVPQYHNTFTIHMGTLHARLFLASRLQRVHGLKPFAVYLQWRHRVRLQMPFRRNLAMPLERDLPGCEVLRSWSGLTTGDVGCDPTYRATKSWAELAAADPSNRYACEQAGVYERQYPAI